MKEKSDKERAKKAAFRLLSIRARSCGELRERLVLKGFAAEVIDKTLADLEERGLLNDAEFARNLVETRLKLRPAGAAVLRRELLRRHIDGPLAEEVVAAALDEAGELHFAIELAKTRLSRLTGNASQGKVDKKAIEKLGRFLAGRGFSYEVIRQVINKFKGTETLE